MRYRLTDRLLLLKEEELFKENDIRIEIMTQGELEKLPDHLSHKKVLLHDMEHIQYCKAEMFGNCIIGTFAVPDVKNIAAKRMEFGFYIMKKRIIFVENTGEYVKSILGRVKEIRYGDNVSLAMFFTGFMDYLIEGDSVFLQEYEGKLIETEDAVVKKIQKNSYETILRYRKDMLHLRAYFTQLESLGDVFRSNTNHLFSEEERNLFAIFSHRVSRLNSHAEMLQEYVIQIREMHQSQLDFAQNRTMKLLTVVTMIFMPLTLLVGWYGMNFVHMPELSWQYGYVGAIMFSIVILVTEIIIFRKKHLL